MLLKCLACRNGNGSSGRLATPPVMSAHTLGTSASFIPSCPEGARAFDPQRGRTAGDVPVSVCGFRVPFGNVIVSLLLSNSWSPLMALKEHLCHQSPSTIALWMLGEDGLFNCFYSELHPSSEIEFWQLCAYQTQQDRDYLCHPKKVPHTSFQSPSQR